MESKLPETEQRALTQAIEDAELLATLNRVATGFRWLLKQRQRAERAQAEGFPWAEELVRGCQQALDEYEDRHPLRR